MKKITNQFLNEEYYVETIDNGMQVFLKPKTDLNRSYAMLSVKYGSINQEFKVQGHKEIIKTPAGVAHFLEHKMFEMPNGIDATNLFAALGADVNAYTSHENTSYYFSTVTNFSESLELLLDFVQTPYFTEESVETEKGIIEQEIITSLDRPTSVSYQGILKNLFKENKVSEDIGGTIESIKTISKDVLQTCYDIFYHPKNMILVVVGNFDLNQTIELIKNNQKNKTFKPYTNPQTIYYLEDNQVNIEENITTMDINNEVVNVGVKFDLATYSPYEITKLAILLDFVLEELFSYSSNNYQQWLRAELIDYSFDYSFALAPYFAYLMIGGETTKSRILINNIKEVLLNLSLDIFDEERFKNYLRGYIGYEIRKFNSVEAIANNINDKELDHTHLFDTINILNTLKFSDLTELLKLFEEKALSIFIIKPNQQ